MPAGRYAKFVVHGDMVQAVAAAWQEIWKLDLPRTFQCDFEEYQNDSMDQAEIHIYIGLKNLSNNG
ncbi:MAG: GyrI-like domain-containing protein [Lachnospiraceae bacterium]|nr:GyrI-like domain-containing protein [Lachnospiraceae bacterium]